MAKYETVAVFSLKNGEEKAKELVEKFKSLIEANGTMEAVDEWGTRKLAYPINYETDGYYVLYTYEAGVDFPAELDRLFNIDENVMRAMTIKLDVKAIEKNNAAKKAPVVEVAEEVVAEVTETVADAE